MTPGRRNFAIAARGIRGMLRGVVLGVLLAFSQNQAALAQTKNVREAIDVIVMFCVAGGKTYEFSGTVKGDGLDLKKQGGTISQSERQGLVDGINDKMNNLTAAQASEARKCMQPYISDILKMMSGTSTPPSNSLPSKSSWNHNASLMSIVTEGDRIRIYYVQPRQAMINEGVRSGTLLFEGHLAAANAVVGTAHVFDRGCSSGIPYPVSGNIVSDARKIILTGQAPNQLDRCRPVAFRPDTLVFDR
jgi:hypothetical protein